MLTTKSKSWRLWVPLSAAIAAIALGFSEWSAVRMFGGSPFSGRHFDSNTGKAYEHCASDEECWQKAFACQRGQMVEDLTTRHLPYGATRLSIESLLGPPSKIVSSGPHTCIEYDLGNCSGLRSDADFLVLCFDVGPHLVRIHRRQG